MGCRTNPELHKLHILRATARQGIYNAERALERVQERLEYWRRRLAHHDRMIDEYHAQKGTDPRKRGGGFTRDMRYEKWERLGL